MSAATPVGQVLGAQIELVSYRWAPVDSAALHRELTLYWRAVSPAHTDLRTSLQLIDAQGVTSWEWKRSPGAGRFSTDRWPVGRLVADRYAVPAGQLGQAQRVEIGMRPFPEGAWLALEDGAVALELAKP